jgi:hypothetical protein
MLRFWMICVLCLLCWMPGAWAADVPASTDIDRLAQDAAATWSNFARDTSAERLQFELLGSFIDTAAAGKLATVSQSAAGKFADIAAREDAMRASIEDYQGQDWEARYGSTGLWRRLKAEICRAGMLKCEAVYWQAAATSGMTQARLLDSASREMADLVKDSPSRQMRFLQARILCQTNTKSGQERRSGLAILDELCDSADRDALYLPARFERYTQNNLRDAAELNELWSAIKAAQSTDQELWMRVGFAGWRQGQKGWLKDVVAKWPTSRDLLSRCVLAEVKRRFDSSDFRWVGEYEAALAADAAAVHPDAYADVIAALAREYRSGSVLRAMGLSLVKTEPLKAATLLSGAAARLEGDDAIQVAGQAAHLAYDEFRKDRSCCKEAAPVIAHYVTLAPSPEPEMVYCHYLTTFECGDANEAGRILETLAHGPAGEFQKKAACILAVKKADEALDKGLIAEAAAELTGGLDQGQGDAESLASAIVGGFLARSEEYDTKTAENCLKLARYSTAWSQGTDKSHADLMVLELNILMGRQAEGLGDAEKELGTDHGDVMRCRARLLMARGDWQKAGAEWARICQQTIAQSEGDQRPWQWWRAKYYQLLCWSRGEDATKEELARRVAVTLNSCGPVPEFWRKKLSSMNGQP